MMTFLFVPPTTEFDRALDDQLDTSALRDVALITRSSHGEDTGQSRLSKLAGDLPDTLEWVSVQQGSPLAEPLGARDVRSARLHTAYFARGPPV